MTEQLYVTSPVGKIIWGSVTERVTTDMKGNPMRDKQGNERSELQFGLAIPKSDPGFQPFWDQIRAKAAQDWPQGEHGRDDFSWKVLNGDNPEKVKSEHGRGCWVLRLKTGMEIQFYDNQPQPNQIDPSGIYPGCFVRVSVGVKGNGDATRPGMFISPSMVQLIGYGDRIVSGPPPAEVFGAPAAMPAGASATPVATGPVPAAGGAPPAAAAGMPPAGPAAPAAQPGPQAGVQVPGPQGGVQVPGPAAGAAPPAQQPQQAPATQPAHTDPATGLPL